MIIVAVWLISISISLPLAIYQKVSTTVQRSMCKLTRLQLVAFQFIIIIIIIMMMMMKIVHIIYNKDG